MNDTISDKVYAFEQVVYEMKTEGQISDELMQMYVTWSRLCKDSMAVWELKQITKCGYCGVDESDCSSDHEMMNTGKKICGQCFMLGRHEQ